MVKTTAMGLVLAVGVGCVPAGGGGGGGGGVSTVPVLDFSALEAEPNDQPGELDEGARQAICDAQQARFEAVVSDDMLLDLVCAANAIFDATAFDDEVEFCEAEYARCTRDSMITGRGSNGCVLHALAGCEITVGEVDACFRWQLGAYLDYIDDFTCGWLHDPPPAVTFSPACGAIDQACPGVIDWGEADSTLPVGWRPSGS